ncbi:hypothetical protein TUM3794_21020 [Shewanella colwelliana]|uniref:Competence protein CoiA-like N-terminal domain-containing protein n=1 Tax=Shewanella colwelliana TaxID=23 RepID=A0ABQ4P146_SHECO|nr:hypothetical protein [Shewanella colwelliana]GIU41141.1 hypothetical protein TUM3794_21020 [Shewanella colwelliana]
MNLIPFGLRSDGVYIDAEDATRGKACDCVCPSCGLALIARKGESYAKHFAHDPNGGSKEDIEACQFSFFVSVRFMLKQLFEEKGVLLLPPLEIEHEGSKHTITKSATITVEPGNILADTYELDVMFDFILNITDRKLCLYITHPGRPEPIYQSSVVEQHTAILGLDLMHFSKLFNESVKVKTAKQLCLEWLETGIQGKRWIYNPRHHLWLEHQRTITPHDTPKYTSEWLKSEMSKLEPLNVVGMYRCVFCNLDFEGHSLLNRCPKCKDHLSVVKKSQSSRRPSLTKYKYRYR